MKQLIALLAGCLLAGSAIANEALIRQVMQAKLGGATIEGIQAGPAGLFEVRFRTEQGVRIIYTDAKAQNIVVGSIYDAKSDRNLTEERLRKLTAISFDSLPLDQAVKVVNGNGKRVLAVFSDPYCPACKQFESVLAQTNDVTIHYFIFPVIRPELIDQSISAWCAQDRAKAWLELARRHVPPAANTGCDHPVHKNIAFGQSLGVNATPTLFFANGERMSGGLPLERLRAMLDDAAASVATR